MSSLGVRIACTYVAFFLVVGLQLAWWPKWLEGRGLSAEAIGIVLAAGMAVRILSTPLAGALADRAGERRRPMIVLALGATAAALLFVPASTFWTLLLATLLFSTCFPTLVPMIDAVSARAARTGAIDYGRVRLWGSVAFVAANLGGGWFVQAVGIQAVLPAVIGLVALTGATLVALPDDRPRPGAARSSLRAAARLARSPAFVLCLLGAATVQASHAVYYGFGTIHWTARGISETTVGALWAVGVVVEVLLFAVAGRAAGRHPVAFLALGGAVATVRWVLTASDPDLGLLVGLQALHGISFGATHLGAVAFVGRAVPDELGVTGQTAFAAVGAGTLALVTAAAGPAYTAWGAGAFGMAAAVAACGLATCLVLGWVWDGSVVQVTGGETPPKRWRGSRDR